MGSMGPMLAVSLLLLLLGVAVGQVPSAWRCSRSYYNAADGCDCECGAWDPDCDRADNTDLYCGADLDRAGRRCDRGTLRCVAQTPAPTTTPPGTGTGTGSWGLRRTENLAGHRTGKFYATEGFEPTDVLVLRRGQGFVVEVPAGTTRSTTSAPRVEIGGRALGVRSGTEAGTWVATIPGTFEVGRGGLTIDGEGHGTVTVLFNPYEEGGDAETYVRSAGDRAEYVENEYGRYWYGDVYESGLAGAGSSGWAFGQYDVLNYVVELVEKVPAGERGDARKVARRMTYLLNNAGEGSGVLYGRWDGRYSDGTAPWVWTGSRAILKQWSESGQRPVRYGQCWVFACLLTTVLRTLGIAARPVTNFRSAHEVKPFDFVVEESKGDSIWNFHAWVDAMLARDDLGASFGDVQWNAVDATPQETSEGRYQMGPAALRVMRTNVDHAKAYDTRFVVSEVNAAVLRNGVRVHDDVGRFVSTKRAGCDGEGHACREDITSQYKAFDDPWTTGARKADPLGVKGAKEGKGRMTPKRYDELAGFELGARGLEVGGDVEFFVRALGPVGLDGAAGGATASFRVEVVSYTGVLIAELGGERAGAAAPGGRSSGVRVSEEEYGRYVGRAGTLRVTAEVRNMVGLLVYSHTHKFELVYPRLEVVAVRGSTEVVVRVHNPLAVPLTRGRVTYSTPAADHVHKVPSVDAGGDVVVTLAGRWCNREHQAKKKIVLSFSADELGGNRMHAEVDIEC